MTQPQRSVPPLKPMPSYRRDTRQWWRHARAPYRWYFLRELTCLPVAYYALLLIVALQRLLAGEAAFTQFITALRSPLWLALNLLALAGVAWHAATWFGVMPKTMPFLYWRGQRVPDQLLVRGGFVAWALASAAVFAAFWITRP